MSMEGYELEKALKNRNNLVEYLHDRGLGGSVKIVKALFCEIDRMRRIEDGVAPVISDPLVSAKSVRDLRAIVEANPRPGTNL